MTRRVLVLALPQAVQQAFEQDQWAELAKVWNPFAAQMNRGVLDLKQWKKVAAVVRKIDGERCK